MVSTGNIESVSETESACCSNPAPLLLETVPSTIEKSREGMPQEEIFEDASSVAWEMLRLPLYCFRMAQEMSFRMLCHSTPLLTRQAEFVSSQFEGLGYKDWTIVDYVHFREPRSQRDINVPVMTPGHFLVGEAARVREWLESNSETLRVMLESKLELYANSRDLLRKELSVPNRLSSVMASCRAATLVSMSIVSDSVQLARDGLEKGSGKATSLQQNISERGLWLRDLFKSQYSSWEVPRRDKEWEATVFRDQEERRSLGTGLDTAATLGFSNMATTNGLNPPGALQQAAEHIMNATWYMLDGYRFILTHMSNTARTRLLRAFLSSRNDAMDSLASGIDSNGVGEQENQLSYIDACRDTLERYVGHFFCSDKSPTNLDSRTVDTNYRMEKEHPNSTGSEEDERTSNSRKRTGRKSTSLDEDDQTCTPLDDIQPVSGSFEQSWGRESTYLREGTWPKATSFEEATSLEEDLMSTSFHETWEQRTSKLYEDTWPKSTSMHGETWAKSTSLDDTDPLSTSLQPGLQDSASFVQTWQRESISLHGDTWAKSTSLEGHGPMSVSFERTWEPEFTSLHEQTWEKSVSLDEQTSITGQENSSSSVDEQTSPSPPTSNILYEQTSTGQEESSSSVGRTEKTKSSLVKGTENTKSSLGQEKSSSSVGRTEKTKSSLVKGTEKTKSSLVKQLGREDKIELGQAAWTSREELSK